MTRGISRSLALAGLALLDTGCSWTRYDDTAADPPVVGLKRPDKASSFGGFVATVSSEALGDTRVLVGGAAGKNRAIAFSLGTGTDPKTDAVDTGSCDQAVPCMLADSAAGLGTADVGAAEPEDACFVFGVGRTELADEHGLIGRCANSTEYTLPVPPRALGELIKGEILLQDAPAPLALAADRAAAPALIAGSSLAAARMAWFYPPLSVRPVELVPPGERDPSFGAAVAALRMGEGDAARRVYAVGAPEARHVWLFDDGGRPVGCFDGAAGFGVALAAGRVDGDDLDDLVVGAEGQVTVVSGAALSGLAPAASITCSLAALPPGGLLASFDCGSSGRITGCPGGFGESLAVGDLDGDGDGEVLAGVPRFRVRGERAGGAVLVYDVEGERPYEVTSQLYSSAAEAGDELGASLVAAPIDGRDVVVAGAPGGRKAAVFYCPSLLTGGGSRCE